MRGYPVVLAVEGKRCVVVGGGPVARRKVVGLLDCGADVTVIAPDLDADLARLGAEGRVTVERRTYRPGDVAGYRLAIAATGDREVDASVHADAEVEGIWVNSADDPEHCTFTLPSVARRGDITVSVATGGRSPALAAWLRRQLEVHVGSEHETLLDLLDDVRREQRSRGVATETLDWQKALDSGMLDLIRDGRIAEAKERLLSCL